jgi:hypothetical protein
MQRFADGGSAPTVFVKRGQNIEDATRLGHEAVMLRKARHPGVVHLESAGVEGHGEVRTTFAGSRTLASVDLGVERRLRILAAVAHTVADLHAVGLVHARLDEHHVVIDSGDRPTICGFGSAGLAGDPAAGPASDRGLLRPALDVATLGRLLERITAPGAADRATGGRTRRRPGHRGPRRGDLRRLVEQATSVDPSQRPTARRFGAHLDHLCGPTRRGRLGRAVSTGPRRPGRRAALVGVTAGVVVAALALSRQGPDSPAAPPPQPITIAAHRYAIGTPTDRVVIADWNCDGQPTAVVVRPSGAVYRFDGWAEPDHDLVGIPAGSWSEAGALVVGQDDAGCPVFASTGRGPTVTLDPDPGLPGPPGDAP